MLARRHRLAGPRRDADLGLELPDDRGGRRALGRSDPRGGRGRRLARASTAARTTSSAAAGYAAQFHESLGERPVGARRRSTRCARRSAARCPTRAARTPPSFRADRRRGAWHRRIADRPLLRLRLRERPAAAVAADWLGTLGPERDLVVSSPAAAAAERSRPNGLPSCCGLPSASAAASSPERRLRTRPRSPRASTTCSRGGLGRRARRPRRRAAAPRRRRRERHVTIDRSLRLLGLGTRARRVPVDGQGRMRADAVRALAPARRRRSSALRPAT